VIHAGGEPGEVAGDEVEVDVVERAGVRVGAERDLSARIALVLRDPGRKREDASDGREVGNPLGPSCCRRRADGCRDRLERRQLASREAPRKRGRLQIPVDLERQRLVVPVEKVAARANAPLAVLGRLVVVEGGFGVAVLQRLPPLDAGDG
jgi:hypothetical protein